MLIATNILDKYLLFHLISVSPWHQHIQQFEYAWKQCMRCATSVERALVRTRGDYYHALFNYVLLNLNIF